MLRRRPLGIVCLVVCVVCLVAAATQVMLTAEAGPGSSPAEQGSQAGQAPPAQAAGRGGPGPRPLTAADYARAERFLAPALTGMVVGGSVTANWLPDERFWYRTQTADGA